jgi:hypothetical protein
MYLFENYQEEPYFVFQPSSHLTEIDLNIEYSILFDKNVYQINKDEKYKLEEEIMFNKNNIFDYENETMQKEQEEFMFNKNNIFEYDYENETMQKEEEKHIEKQEEMQVEEDYEEKQKNDYKDFDKMLNLVKQFKDKYEWYPVSSKIKKFKGYNLYHWLLNIRLLYKKGELDKDSINKFQQLKDWEWDYKTKEKQKNWIEKYDKIKNGKKKDRGIFSWIYRQKKAYKNKTLDKLHIKLLEEIPNWTWKFGK